MSLLTALNKQVAWYIV